MALHSCFNHIAFSATDAHVMQSGKLYNRPGGREKWKRELADGVSLLNKLQHCWNFDWCLTLTKHLNCDEPCLP